MHIARLLGGTVTRAEPTTNSTIPASVILLEANYAITEGEPVTALTSRCSPAYRRRRR